MRQSSCMNDYMEVEHGFRCLNAAYGTYRDRIQTALDGAFPGFCEKLEARFNSWLPHIRSDSYICCVSEHDLDEDVIGRLSMWRAYGTRAGVGIVMNGAPFLRPTDALRAYTSPVAYLSSHQFESEFASLVERLEQNRDRIASLGEEMTIAYIFSTFRSAIVCTKHPGFREEREWRVVHSPLFEKSERIRTDVQTVGGTPQPICKIPLKDCPEEGLHGIEIPSLVDRIIIGPTQYPLAVYQAFVELLTQAGVTNAGQRVKISDIPLRT